MRQRAVTFLFFLFAVPGLANAQFQPYGGSFAAVPVPGQPAAPVTPAPIAPPTPGVARPPTPPTPGAKPVEEQLRIVADPATNSLIIYGTAQEFQNVKNILKELDAIPRQVLIEALILQVDLKDTQDFGVDYEVLRRSRTTIFGQTFGSRAALTTLGKLFPTAPAFSGVTGLSGIVGDDTVSAIIRAAATDSRVKIISSPSVLASDNRPARIQVGSEEPIPTGTINTASGNPNVSSSTTIQYRNTGRILTIIPQVNAQGLVNLQVKAEVSARGDDVKVGQDSFPAFNTQDAETTAVVHDGETLVIGGLIGERKSKGRSGIPYLMDLPILGRFFGTTNDSTERNELVMLITPRVIRNREESRDVTEEFKSKLSSVRNELEKIRRDRERDLEKLKSQKREPAKPAEPPVPPVEPAPPPVSAPARPGAYFSPVAPSAFTAPDGPLIESDVRDNDRPPVVENQKSMEMLLADIEAAVESSKQEKPSRISDSIAKLPKTEEITVQPVRSPTEPAAAPTRKSATVWVVQVASYVQMKDADLLAKRLRDKGYDVQVRTADVGGRTWHRVQVGQLPSRQEAFELQRSLKSSEKMEQAFVASR